MESLKGPSVVTQGISFYGHNRKLVFVLGMILVKKNHYQIHCQTKCECFKIQINENRPNELLHVKIYELERICT